MHMSQPIEFLERSEAIRAPTLEKAAAIAAVLKAGPNARNETPANTPWTMITKDVAAKRAEKTQIDQASGVAVRGLMSPTSSCPLCSSACASLKVADRGLMGSRATLMDLLINRTLVYGSL